MNYTEKRYNETIEDCGYAIGQEVPYRNTRSNIKSARIDSFVIVDSGRVWFKGVDTVSKANVYYPVHLSKELQVKTS